jgi:hypothetical protein
MPALLHAIVSLSASIAQSAARHAAITLAGLLLSGTFLIASVAFFTLAAYRALAQSIGQVHAPLVVGTAYLVAALITALFLQRR